MPGALRWHGPLTSISIRARASIATGTLFIYNFGRREVQGFLIASALHWLERYHVDGLRVDAVASMLYRDYSRPADGWIPNIYGGRENLEAIGFLRHLNAVVGERCPGRHRRRRGNRPPGPA